MSDPLYAYLDTNVLVEFRPPRDLDWRSILSSPRVVLVVASVVLRELQEIKDGGKYPAIKRRRAGERIKWISEVLLEPVDSGPARLQDGVDILYDGASVPTEIYVTHHLDTTIGDDRLIASALGGLARGWGVCVVSDDIGARIQSKTCGLRSVSPPQEARCPAEPDPLEQEIRELKKQLAEHQARHPKLALAFSDGTLRLKSNIHKPLPVNDEQIEHRLACIRDMLSLDSVWQKTIVAVRGRASEGGRRRYLQQCEVYLEKLAPLLPAMIEHHNAQELHVEFDGLALVNSGTVPAEAVEVHMWAPDFVRWVQEAPEGPKLPSKPDLPPPAMEELYTHAFSAAHRFEPNIDAVSVVTISTSPPQFRIDGQKATFGISKLKHGQSKMLPRILFAFESFETVQSLSIKYCVYADNVLKKQEGEINVQVLMSDRYREAEVLGYEPVGRATSRRL